MYLKRFSLENVDLCGKVRAASLPRGQIYRTFNGNRGRQCSEKCAEIFLHASREPKEDMMRLGLKYGNGTLSLVLPDSVQAEVFEPKEVPFLENPVARLNAALDAPVGGLRLEDRPAPRSVSIAVPDETRPFPLKLLLPPFLERIFKTWPKLCGEDVTIVVGGGLHRAADKAQLKRILPEDIKGCRVVAHDAGYSPFISFGRTSRGTPVEINAEYSKAELRMVMGMVDAHQFAGFTGGAKGVVIGCASAAMIAINHRMMTDKAAFAGNIADNPVRQDMNEAGELAGVALAINVVLDHSKRPVAIWAGLPAMVMLEAARVTRELYGLAFAKPYDIVIASCGGSPKDICLYQAQKGFNTATQCAAPGAGVILAAKCDQGIGDDVYYNYVRQFNSNKELMLAFTSGPFKMGAHKAFLFARAAASFETVIHTDLPGRLVKECLLVKGDLQSTVDRWLRAKKSPRIAVIKNANSSFFRAD